MTPFRLAGRRSSDARLQLLALRLAGRPHTAGAPITQVTQHTTHGRWRDGVPEPRVAARRCHPSHRGVCALPASIAPRAQDRTNTMLLAVLLGTLLAVSGQGTAVSGHHEGCSCATVGENDGEAYGRHGSSRGRGAGLQVVPREPRAHYRLRRLTVRFPHTRLRAATAMVPPLPPRQRHSTVLTLPVGAAATATTDQAATSLRSAVS